MSDDSPESLGDDPTGPASGSSRSYRGGSLHFDSACRSEFRKMLPPSSRYGYLGFRVVCVPTGE